MNSVYRYFLVSADKGDCHCLATIMQTRGSTPQQSGSSALFTENGIITGTLGGGVMEAEAERVAKEVIRTGKSRIIDFSLNNKITDDFGAICGGNALILLDASPADSIPVFRKAIEFQKSGKSGLLISIIESGEESMVNKITREIIDVDESGRYEKKYPGIREVLLKAHRSNSSQLFKDQTVNESCLQIFIEPVKPPSKLLIVGAGHIGRALAPLANNTGFDLKVIDNRPEMLKKGFFPEGTDIGCGPIEEEIEKTKIDENTYIVIVTQGHHHDSDALRACIHSPAAYIGMIGSVRKINQMRDHFIKNKWCTPQEFNSIYAPVGLDIHAETIEEIALSIAAQLVMVRKKIFYPNIGKRIASVILAAGKSTRMGRQKMLMPFGDSTIIETIIKNSLSSKTGHTVAVLGSDREKIETAISDYNVEVSYNSQFEQGMLSSVQHGFQSVSGKAEAVLVLLGDQPSVTKDLINTLIKGYKKSDKKILIPVYQGKRGHPVIIDMCFSDEINRLDPEKGLKSLMGKYPDEIEEMEVDDPGILKDIDTKEDYNEAIIN